MTVPCEERDLAQALQAMCDEVDGALQSAVRAIGSDDDRWLTRAEREPLMRSALSVRRASGAARHAARGLLAAMGQGAWDIVRSPSGAPRWPDGVIGSIAHDDVFAAVAIGRESALKGVGIDIEAATPLDRDLAAIVATDRELAEARGDLMRLKILFCLKEAIYKALRVEKGAFVDFRDVEVFWDQRKAIVKGAVTVDLRWTSAPRILALGFIR
jgi:4'-phosphopantetheinyl transferase EntD